VSLRLKTTDIGSIANRKLFFDANVLLYLFAPIANNSNQWAINAYSRIFNHCLKSSVLTCVDVFVISEFINRSFRIEYEKYLKINGKDRSFSFKAFRSTTEGLDIAKDIDDLMKGTVLRRFDVVGKAFDKADILAINLINSDFNDELIIRTCKEHQCVLVTNDADFSGADIDILSANNKLT
jgi:predicted nucleic acid-binding protein